jgi:hypothetical protein
VNAPTWTGGSVTSSATRGRRRPHPASAHRGAVVARVRSHSIGRPTHQQELFLPGIRTAEPRRSRLSTRRSPGWLRHRPSRVDPAHSRAHRRRRPQDHRARAKHRRRTNAAPRLPTSAVSATTGVRFGWACAVALFGHATTPLSASSLAAPPDVSVHEGARWRPGLSGRVISDNGAGARGFTRLSHNGRLVSSLKQ